MDITHAVILNLLVRLLNHLYGLGAVPLNLENQRKEQEEERKTSERSSVDYERDVRQHCRSRVTTFLLILKD